MLKFFPKKYLFDELFSKAFSILILISSVNCLLMKIFEFKSLQVFS